EPGFEERVRALPQVARAEFLRSGRILLDPSRAPLVLIARDRAEKAFPKVGAQYARRPGDPPLVWVSEAVGDLFGFSAGRRVELPINGKSVPLIVAGLFRDYARQHGSVLIDRADYASLTGDRRVNDAALWLAPGATPAQAMDAIRALPGSAGIDLGTPGEIRQLSLSIFDRSFAVTYAMEAVAMLVGLFGLSSSLGAIVLARRREFGMLRHLGLTRAQIRAMLAAEGGLLALLGALAGLAAGAAISLPLVSWAAKLRYPVVTPRPQFVFPRDHGAHPDYRTEWWYVTGWLDGPLGFQITFFRARPREPSDNPSRFNPLQVLLAHAAIADPKRGRLIHEERAARAGFTLAHAETERT